MGINGTLNGTFAPPALTNSVHFSSGAVTSYFNISDFSLEVVYKISNYSRPGLRHDLH